MTFNQDLYHLITSLSAKEKRFVLKELSESSVEKKLFDLYNSSIPPEMKTLKGIPNFRVRENQLIENTLKYLRIIEKDVEKEIMELMMDAKTLFNRAIPDLAAKKLAKAKQKAQKYERFGLLIAINNWERIIADYIASNNAIFIGDFVKDQALIEMDDYLEILSQKQMLNKIKESLSLLNKKEIKSGKEKLMKKANNCVKKGFLSVSNEMLYLFCKQSYIDLLKEPVQYTVINNSIIEFQKKHSFLREITNLVLLQALISMSLSAISKGNIKEYLECYEEIQSLNITQEIEKVFLYQYLIDQELGYIVYGRLPKKKAMERYNLLVINYHKYKSKFKKDEMLYTPLNFCEVCFRYEEYEKAERWLKTHEDKYKKNSKLHPKLRIKAEMYRLFFLFEAGFSSTKSLHTKSRNIWRKISKEKYTQSAKALIDFMKSVPIIKHNRNKIILTNLKALQDKLNVYKKTKEECIYLRYELPILEWVERKIRQFES